MAYAIEWAVDRVTVTFTGRVSTADLLAGARIVGADPRFDELRFIVNDFRTARLGALDREAVLEGLVESVLGGAVSNPAIRVVVVSDDPQVVELVQSLRTMMDGAGPVVAVFDDEAQAREWMRTDAGPRPLRPRFEG